jgi:hypothetical protein
MRTVESLLTTTVKRFVGCICDLAETRAPRPLREGNQMLRQECLSLSLTGITMAAAPSRPEEVRTAVAENVAAENSSASPT